MSFRVRSVNLHPCELAWPILLRLYLFPLPHLLLVLEANPKHGLDFIPKYFNLL